MPTELINRATGQREQIEDADVNAAIAGGKYIAPAAVAVHRFGYDTYASPDVAAREAPYAPTVDPAKAAAAQGHEIREKRNTGALATAKAALGGGLSGLTMGIVDPFAEEREFHGIAGGIGEVAGALAPAFIGDLGGLFGAAGIADDALTAERAAGAISSKTLLGGAKAAEGTLAAGEAAAAGARAEGGLAKSLQAAADAVHGAGELPEDLSQLDRAGLRAARQQELDVLNGYKKDSGRAFSNNLEDYRKELYEQDVPAMSKGAVAAEDAGAREAGGALRSSDFQLRRLLDNKAHLAENPRGALQVLQKQDQAMSKLLEWAQAEEKAHEFQIANIGESTRAEILAGRVEGEVPSAWSKERHAEALELAVERHAPRRLEELRDLADRRQLSQITQTYPEVIESNRELQRQLGKLLADPTSERLDAIQAAEDALNAPAPPPEPEPPQSLGSQLIEAVVPYAGPLGKIFKGVKHAVGKVGEIVGSSAKRSSEAISNFLSEAPRKVGAHVAVLATQTLADHSFGADEPSRLPPSEENPLAKAPAPELARLYKSRSDQVKSLTAYDETGTPRVRADVRAEMAARLAGIRAASPLFADKLETIAVRRLEHYAAVMPRRPDIGGVQIGPDNWRPSDLEMRSWARTVAAGEDPHGVEQRLVNGTITPEDVAAMRTIYPERYQEMLHEIAMNLGTLRKTLPYQKRLAFSIFSGQPVDPAMHPKVLAVLQGSFAADNARSAAAPGNTPHPAFGAIKKSIPDPTPAQSVSQGARA